MLIVGAKGFAKEVLQVQHQLKDINNLVFFDNLNKDITDKLYDCFPVLRNEEAVITYFREIDNRFTIGIGSSKNRKKLYDYMKRLGGVPTSTISPFSHIGNYQVQVGEACNIMTGTVITNDISIGKGCLINLNCTIGHDSQIGDFVELSPNVNVSGKCEIGSFTTIGTNATILPNIKIGENCIIGAGTVVTKNIPNNSVVVGIPGKVIKQNI
ncbi:MULTISPECIES: acetyltransferase [Flavobacteriaceae]|uniref:acetyltransferase n=1 Tax=Flavobacteriaceae TaxID=49546 RepID=UPI003A94B4C9